MRVLRARCFSVGLLAVAAACWMTSDAAAFGRRHASYGSYASAGSYGSYASAGSYGSYASAGSYASSGSYASAGSYASYGSHGSHGGLFARWHARKAARKAARASYASHGSYASTGSYGSAGSYASAGSHGSYASSYSGSAGSHGSVHYSAPMEYSVPSDNPPAPPSESVEAPADSATINTRVPADAIVYVNGKRTVSTGAERSFVSRGLESGKTYSYQLRVEYAQDGEPQVAERRLQLRAGQAVEVAFGARRAVDESLVKTELKLSVPADAKVFLAGAATRQEGEQRVYASTQLQEGQTWNGYTVRVELDRDGQQLVEERTLDIVGGQTYELAIQFDAGADQLALAD